MNGHTKASGDLLLGKKISFLYPHKAILEVQVTLATFLIIRMSKYHCGFSGYAVCPPGRPACLLLVSGGLVKYFLWEIMGGDPILKD